MPRKRASSERRKSFAIILAPPVTAALMASVWSMDFVRELENVTIDWRFKVRAESDPAPDQRIALIGIGEYSLENIGRWQDWTRATHGQFLEQLTYRPPAVVAFDLFFPEVSHNTKADEIFSHFLAFHPNAITGMYIEPEEQDDESESKPPYLGNTRPITRIVGDPSAILSSGRASVPIPSIAESSWTGSVNFPPSEVDGMRRQLPLVTRIAGQVYPSLVLQILMRLENADPDSVTVELGKAVRVPRESGGEWSIPVDEGGFFYVNYRRTDRFPEIDFYATYQQIQRTAAGEPWPSDQPPIENQVVIIGQSAVGLSDFGPTPYRALDPLFRVQATALDSILREDYVRTFPLPWVIGTWLVIAWGTVVVLRKAPIGVAIAVPALIVVSVIASAFYLFARDSILLPLVIPTVGFVLIHTTVIGDRLMLELQEKRYIRGVFGSYVSPAIVNQIINSGQTPELGGEEVDLTILFSDIQGFSTFSEQLPPKRLVELMVEYLSEMTDLVTDNGGTLDKYIGDAIDAMFGAPVELPGNASKGVWTAILMQRKQVELQDRWKQQDAPDLVRNMRTRIGLNTGRAVVGNMGSRRRFNYTMMGDNVNLAARCESGAKNYGVYTMVTEATHDEARKERDDIVYRYLDRIIVKGRTLPVKVYEVIETEENVDGETRNCLEIYAEALEKYFAQEWDAARDLFEQASEFEPNQPDRDPGIATNPSRVMAARCGLMKEDPPGEDWDGVYRMTTK